jgi:acyl carrier protein
MTSAPFTVAVQSIARLAKADPTTLSLKTRISDLPIDSLDLFTVISELEDAFGGTVSDEEMGDMQTLGDIVAFFSSPTK